MGRPLYLGLIFKRYIYAWCYLFNIQTLLLCLVGCGSVYLSQWWGISFGIDFACE